MQVNQKTHANWNKMKWLGGVHIFHLGQVDIKLVDLEVIAGRVWFQG